jgi:putative ABC transport system permease protein
MFRHNILISYRNFLRYKSSFFINLLGLSSGLACALLIHLWIADEMSVDKFHRKGDQLYQVLRNVERPGRTIQDGQQEKQIIGAVKDFQYGFSSP